MEGLVGLLPIVAILLLFWLLLIRPQARRAREQQRMQSSIEVGDEVMLASGIFGHVLADLDDRVEIEIAPGVAVTVLRAAISRVVRDEAPADESVDEVGPTGPTDPTDPADEPSMLRKRPTSGPEES